MTEPGNEKSVWNYVIVNNDAMVKEMVIYEDRNINIQEIPNSSEITHSDYHTIEAIVVKLYPFTTNTKKYHKKTIITRMSNV